MRVNGTGVLSIMSQWVLDCSILTHKSNPNTINSVFYPLYVVYVSQDDALSEHNIMCTCLCEVVIVGD